MKLKFGHDKFDTLSLCNLQIRTHFWKMSRGKLTKSLTNLFAKEYPQCKFQLHIISRYL